MATTSSVEDGPSTTLPTSTPPAPQSTDIPSQEKDDTDAPISENKKLDIEHVYVLDDPRKWPSTRKFLVLFIISGASMIAGLASNIYNPGIEQMKAQLHASSGQVSLSLALFILIQGFMPLLWSVVSEIKGRKIVYITSIAIAVVGCIVAALSKTIEILIGMRCLQAVGTSAVMAIGAATLADIYDPSERGTMMGIYYAAPLLGPSLGPILGGVLTQYLSWRATFWFLVIFMGCCLIAFVLFFRDTFRRERSMLYQTVLRRLKEQQRAKEVDASKRSSMTVLAELGEKDLAVGIEASDKNAPPEDLEAAVTAPIKEIKLSLRDVNPLPPLVFILRRWNNLVILVASGLIFGYTYCIWYTCALTLEERYHYDALTTGLVLLSFGLGSMGGSILGGRYSDRVLARLRAERGFHVAEMRLQSTKPAMFFLPLPVIAYAWLIDKHTHIAPICIALFFSGFFTIWIYSSTLAYIVDANVGRSSSAVAANSAFRGLFAFIFAEVAVPLQNSIGDGGLYTLWTGLLIICELLILLVLYKGERWREMAEEREARD
ncbi:hypothetical protein EW146_g47 [Bondarzewia mesenterica]|uniref:Major facilitator superfamily (MFS) profile domain-containing protein n=1 Tax=Bondarzewia mesenterica TaxID=1095465 RepID=A0A4S4M898_9AGAM|nr:hypothetical protein EW146_g47 [Bondarzewia mesenterica]